MPRSFFKPSAEIVAPRLLGHWLIRNTPQGPCGGPIVETEAYICGDPACHAFGGETARNRSMWGPPGFSYVYLIYGFHCCFNTVCHPRGSAEAVLVRAIEPSFGKEQMRARRSVVDPRQLTSGPGKLCAALDINRTLDGIDLTDRRSPVFMAENPDVEIFRREKGPILCGRRIGISRAADLLFRFYLEESHWLSRRVKGGKLRLIN